MSKKFKDKYLDLINMPITELLVLASKVRQKYISSDIELCSIINAKSGKCSEDCKYCAQSAYHKTDIDVFSLKSKDEIVQGAKDAKKIGAKRYGIVTSGNSLNNEEINIIADATREIVADIEVEVCGSLGALNFENLQKLKAAGMNRYHHNIETSREFYPSIVSTHTFDERINTIKAAKNVGFTVCCGGIIGLGESWENRISMALTLKELDVDSVPINVLVPVKGTELEDIEAISYVDIIRTIAIFRVILEDKTVRLAAGRETKLKDFQGLGFLAGANGMMIGGYLTVNGRAVSEDLVLKKEIEKLWKV